LDDPGRVTGLAWQAAAVAAPSGTVTFEWIPVVLA